MSVIFPFPTDDHGTTSTAVILPPGKQEELREIDLGQIYTAHTTTYFYDPFTAPFRLDNLLGATADFARNPSICTQFNDTDNDLMNLTEVVLFDRAYNGNMADFDIVGCYNKEAANTDNWFIFGMNATVRQATSNRTSISIRDITISSPLILTKPTKNSDIL